MKAMVDQDGCIACGLCESTCPEVFKIGDSGKAEAKDTDIEEEYEEAAQEARDGCPVSVISITE